MNEPISLAVPRVAAGLGHLAVLPFVCGATLVWLVEPSLRPFAGQVLSTYAAVVVSFIGAIHWGFGFRQTSPAGRLFVWGVVPSLVACFAVLLPPRIGLVIHAVMLTVCYLVDRSVYAQEDVAAWLPLRLRLTTVATVCCIAGAIGA